jgi:hypothetical protein
MHPLSDDDDDLAAAARSPCARARSDPRNVSHWTELSICRRCLSSSGNDDNDDDRGDHDASNDPPSSGEKVIPSHLLSSDQKMSAKRCNFHFLC